MDTIQSFLKQIPACVKWIDKENNNRTGLMYAAENDQLGAVMMLTDIGNADVNAKNARGSTALMFAARKGYDAVVKHLIDCEADVNAVNDEKTTALMVCAWEGQTKMIELLVRNGAATGMQDKDKNTALHFAAINGQQEAAFRLMDLGADKEIKNSEKQNAARAATSAQHPELGENIRTYIPAVSVTPAVAAEDSAFDVVAAAARGEFAEVLAWLENNKEHANDANVRGSTLLMFAAMKGTPEDVKALIALGADPNKSNAHGTTPLMVAASEGKVDICSALLRAGAAKDANDKSSPPMNAADFAHHNGHKELALAIRDFVMPPPPPPPPPPPEKTLPEMLADLEAAKKEALERINTPAPAAKPSKEMSSLTERLRKGKLTD